MLGHLGETGLNVFPCAHLRHKGTKVLSINPSLTEGYFWAALHSGRMGSGDQQKPGVMGAGNWGSGRHTKL